MVGNLMYDIAIDNCPTQPKNDRYGIVIVQWFSVNLHDLNRSQSSTPIKGWLTHWSGIWFPQDSHRKPGTPGSRQWSKASPQWTTWTIGWPLETGTGWLLRERHPSRVGLMMVCACARAPDQGSWSEASQSSACRTGSHSTRTWQSETRLLFRIWRVISLLRELVSFEKPTLNCRVWYVV